MKEAKSSKIWPSVVGEIITSKIESSDETEDSTFQASVIYAYNVNKLPYQSSRIKIGVQWAMGRGEKSEIENFLDKYPANQPVQVFYNPKDPRKAILDKKLDSNSFSLLFLFIIIALLPILLILSDFISNMNLGVIGILFHPIIIIPYAIILGFIWYKLKFWKVVANRLNVIN